MASGAGLAAHQVHFAQGLQHYLLLHHRARLVVTIDVVADEMAPDRAGAGRQRANVQVPVAEMRLVEAGAKKRRLAGQTDPGMLLYGLDPAVPRDQLPCLVGGAA
jgi:hypothetical protein